jgi:hypothetical protein
MLAGADNVKNVHLTRGVVFVGGRSSAWACGSPVDGTHQHWRRVQDEWVKKRWKMGKWMRTWLDFHRSQDILSRYIHNYIYIPWELHCISIELRRFQYMLSILIHMNINSYLIYIYIYVYVIWYVPWAYISQEKDGFAKRSLPFRAKTWCVGF